MNVDRIKGKFFFMSILLSISMESAGCGRQEQDVAEILEEAVISDEVPIVEQRDFPLMKTVCLESMSLRENPGFSSAVVEILYPNTELEWLGETEQADGVEFYRVRVLESGNEGYCSANYCILIDYEYAEDALPYVETENAVYSYDMMVNDLKALSEKYADRLSISSLGQTVEGREIYQAVLGNPFAKRAVFIQAGIHGREYMSTQLVMKMLEYYTLYYNMGCYKNILYQELFQDVCFYVVPMSNPDGISISQFGEAAVSDMKRKEMMRQAYVRDKETLIYTEEGTGVFAWYDAYAWEAVDRSVFREMITYEEYLKLWKANAAGVDLNRNFDVGWDEISQKTEPGCEFYKGPIPESEPETKILKGAVEQRQFDCIINYHARGQLIYFDVKNNSSEVSDRTEVLACLFQELNRYNLDNCKENKNVEAGGLGDWAALSMRIPSITIEVGKYPCPLEAKEFDSIWIRNRETWGKLALRIMEDSADGNEGILCD